MIAPTVLLSEAEIAQRVTDLARAMLPKLEDNAIGVCLLTGGLWFAADLMRALEREGKSLGFDALWLSSYGDGEQAGELILRADLQRPVSGRQVVIMDDVLDTGASLKFARDHLLRAGASDVLTAVMARKPAELADGHTRTFEVDYVAWEAPPRFLVGYGLDVGGKHRGLPFIGAMD
jgi:hypoxanthine phosphoribosyltransferase